MCICIYICTSPIVGATRWLNIKEGGWNQRRLTGYSIASTSPPLPVRNRLDENTKIQNSQTRKYTNTNMNKNTNTQILAGRILNFAASMSDKLPCCKYKKIQIDKHTNTNTKMQADRIFNVPTPYIPVRN